MEQNARKWIFIAKPPVKRRGKNPGGEGRFITFKQEKNRSKERRNVEGRHSPGEKDPSTEKERYCVCRSKKKKLPGNEIYPGLKKGSGDASGK